eukprot:TRINITY_DN371_c0_g1_i1.p1 TRINITY_DN371_c0_g1~~TRINITY_DN371_c0_g1_i1.p1  ORF type:complete len:183 (-),score=35.87 TRINITY_DN371_c0_g1_i1:551-1099(-)
MLSPPSSKSNAQTALETRRLQLLEEAFDSLRYTRSDDIDPSNLHTAEGSAKMEEDCSVCCDQIECTDAITLACGHGFHPSCLQTWLELNPTCPICRQDASEHLVLECRVCAKKFEARRYGNAESARRACQDHMSDKHQETVGVPENAHFGPLEGYDRILSEFTAQLMVSELTNGLSGLNSSM